MAANSINAIVEEITDRYASRMPLLALATTERERALRALTAVIEMPQNVARGRVLFTWTCRKGLWQLAGPGMGTARSKPIAEQVRSGPELIDYIESYCGEVAAGSKPGAIFAVCDLAPFLSPYGPHSEDPLLSCGLRDVAQLGKANGVSIVLVGGALPSTSVDREILHLALPLPDADEAGIILAQKVEEVSAHPEASRLDLRLTAERREAIGKLLLGLTAEEMSSRLLYAIRANRGLGGAFTETLIREKRQIIGRSGAVSWQHSRERAQFGGYQRLVTILEQLSDTFSADAADYGLTPAKGILAVGLPGTGKDYAMTVAASIFNLPLYAMDASFMGAGGGILGQAETTMRDTLARVETQPCLLGISEFEKVFGGVASSHESDGGASARVGALMLNWMASQHSAFIFATANDIRNLAPEQIRQGRFSRILFFDLPGPEDCIEIAAIHLRRRRQDPATLDLRQIADQLTHFSGAEIEAAVETACGRSYRDGRRPVATADLIWAANHLRPTIVAEVKKDSVESLRNWARETGAIDVAAPEPASRPSGYSNLSLDL